MISENFKCPKCGAPVVAWYFPNGECVMVGEEDSDRFQCCGHLIEPICYPNVSKDNPMNRTKSCGYFGLEDLDMECQDNGEEKTEN